MNITPFFATSYEGFWIVYVLLFATLIGALLALISLGVFFCKEWRLISKRLALVSIALLLPCFAVEFFGLVFPVLIEFIKQGFHVSFFFDYYEGDLAWRYLLWPCLLQIPLVIAATVYLRCWCVSKKVSNK